jgi:phage/plasmid-like protein (TIGR03299 family)
MSAEVETMMYTKQVPWHGLGTYVGDDPVLSEDAIIAAGLDWDVAKVPVMGLYDDGDDIHECMTDEFFLNVRTTDRKVLGCVQGRYTVLQNSEAFEFMDALAGPKNLVRYHTAGSLHEGKRIWLLAEVVGLTVEPVPGDPTTPYILLVNGHDGRMPLKALFTSVRVVCQNTLNLALASSDTGVTIRHTGNMVKKVDEAKKVLGFAQTEVERYKELADRLVKVAMKDTEFTDFLDLLIPLEKDKPNTRRITVRDDISALWNAGPGTEIIGVRGTAWNALQAVTNYNTHHRSVRGAGDDDTLGRVKRLEASWYGQGNSLNQKALRILANA